MIFSSKTAFAGQKAVLLFCCGKDELMMKYGVQLFSVRDAAEQDLEKALAAVAAQGYEAVEFAGFFGHEAEVPQWLSSLKLTAAGTHTLLDALESETEKQIVIHKQIGCKRVIVPFIDLSDESKTDDIIRRLNAMQQLLAKEGLQLGYHNHDFEFKPIGGKASFMERLLSETDLFWEADTYWVYAAGEDPVAWMKRASEAGRLPMIHLKDGLSDGSGFPLGMGTAPVESVYRYAAEHGIEMIVESETLQPDGLTETDVCMKWLKAAESRK